MKKILISLLTIAVIITLTACGTGTAKSENSIINVVSREEGSGTRSAFVELTGVEEKNADGNKQDNTSQEAIVVNKTDVMLSTVAGDPSSIGYVSLGSVNETVKVLKVNGVEASGENVKSGDYPIARPFYVATKGKAEGLAQDFIQFVLSKQGQEIVGNGYISVGEPVDFISEEPSGSIVIAGSSSVTPIMEKLVEAYKTVNPAGKIEIQMSDSSAGANSALDGTADIAMISRNLKESEGELTGVVIAMDGIGVIVNPQQETDNLTLDEIKDIFTGKKTTW